MVPFQNYRVKACQAIRKQLMNYVSLMPTNLYGTHDEFRFKFLPFLPAVMRKFHEAKQCARDPVGSGTPMREFFIC
jgi:GDP-L-fucose synthase